METVPTQEILKVEPTNSNESVEQLSDNVQTPADKDRHNQTCSDGASHCNSEPETERNECYPGIKSVTEKFDIKQPGNSFKPEAESLSSDYSDDAEAEVLGNKSLQCEICRRQFSKRPFLRRHMLRIHSKKNECEICGAKFYEKAELNRHRRVHSGEKPFQCDICMKRFKQNPHLIRHRRSHTGEKPFECEVCLKKFFSNSDLNKHRPVHSEEKPFQCEICMKKYKRRCLLKRHRRVHTGELPYQCEICLKRFKEKYFLNKHECVPVGLISNHVSENSVKEVRPKFSVLKTYSKAQKSIEVALE